MTCRAYGGAHGMATDTGELGSALARLTTSSSFGAFCVLASSFSGLRLMISFLRLGVDFYGWDLENNRSQKIIMFYYRGLTL